MNLTLPTTLATEALTRVSDTLADPGLLAAFVAAIGITVLFWVIHQIVELFEMKRQAEWDRDVAKFQKESGIFDKQATGLKKFYGSWPR